MTELVAEKFLKKFIGRTEIEDALKRLDRLAYEEALMATAQVLQRSNVTELIYETVNVHNLVSVVDDRVAGVDTIVRIVDDKVDALIDGAQYTFN